MKWSIIWTKIIVRTNRNVLFQTHLHFMTMYGAMWIFTNLIRSNVFTGVYHYVHIGSALAGGWGGGLPSERVCLLRGSVFWGWSALWGGIYFLRGIYLLRRICPPRYDQPAVGTHPTWMQSCFKHNKMTLDTSESPLLPRPTLASNVGKSIIARNSSSHRL